MDLSADLSRAVRRAETKRQISQLLVGLPADDRQAILLDLLAERASSGRPPRQVQNAPRDVGNGRQGHVAQVPEEGGRTDALVSMLKAKPGVSIGDMAEHVYGDLTEKSRNKTRSLLAALKKRNIVRNTGTGQWEVIPGKV
jgi:hypothetical protein